MLSTDERLAYRPGLDGIRAVAVAGVVLYHGKVDELSGGFLGVDVFFVLSGFLITSLLLHEYALTSTLRLVRFWMARLRRLVPAALAVIVVSLVVIAVFSPEDLRLLRGDALASVLYVNNWHQIFAQRSYFESFGRPSLLQHFWSLAVEEQFYLLWPPLLLAGLTWLSRRTVALLVLLAAVVSVVLMAALYDPHGDPTRIYYGTDTRAMPILIGVVLAFVWPAMLPVKPMARSARVVLDLGGAIGLLVVLGGMIGWTDYDPAVYRGGLLVVALGSAVLIASASHPASRVGKALGIAPLVWIGARSYGIYLWHWPVMALTRPDLDVHVSLVVLVPIQIAITVALATVSYRYLEMPVRRGEAQRRLRAWLATLTPRRRHEVLIGAPALAVALVALVALWPAADRRGPGGPTASAQARAAPVKLHTPRPATTPARASTTTTSSRPHAAPHGPVLMVGASVMLQAIGALEKHVHATVDAEDSRQPNEILDRLKEYRANGALPPVVVVQTGENGPVTEAELKELKHVLRGVPRVVIVNLRYPGENWIDATNEQLKRLVKGWPEATLADWRRASDNPKLLWDGTHPDERGQKVYAEVVARAIGR